MKRILAFLLALMIFGSAAASESKVVVSINPIHSLFASVMEGIGTPDLLVKGTDSVHGYQIKPSDARLLENSDVIVWVGPTLESTLIASISNVQEDKTVIELGTIHGLKLYESRESPDGGHGHEDEDHDDHAHEEEHDEHAHEEEHDEHAHMEDHDDHAHEEEHDDHAHEEEHDKHAQMEDHDEHGDEEGHGHAHGRFDMHVWLDIDNAKVITKEAAEQLAVVFPQHEAQLTSNMNKTLEKLDSLGVELRSLSKPISDSPYVVFHDAYQYLEKMLGLNNVGTVTVNPEQTPGAKRLVELRETISETGASCVFKEPQFDPSTLEIISEDTDLKIGTLDPLGADVVSGPNAYFEIMRNLVLSLTNCLG